MYPNPATTFTNLIFELSEASQIIINVTDAAGKNVKSLQLTGVKGMNQKTIGISAFAAGRYNFTIQAGGRVQTLSLLKSM